MVGQAVGGKWEIGSRGTGSVEVVGQVVREAGSLPQASCLPPHLPPIVSAFPPSLRLSQFLLPPFSLHAASDPYSLRSLPLFPPIFVPHSQSLSPLPASTPTYLCCALAGFFPAAAWGLKQSFALAP